MDARLKSIATAAGVVVTALCLTGCEKLQQSSAEADRAAVAAMREGKLETAAKEKNASPGLRVEANSQLATQRYQEGVDAYAQTLDRQVQVMRLGWRATRFAAVADENIDAARGISKYEPLVSLEKLDQMIGDIRGASDKMTRSLESAQGVDLATITSLDATIDKLNHDIADVQKELAGLEGQRQKMNQQAQELVNQSLDAKGQTSVDLYKRSAESRKAASDLATRIEATGMKLVPLQQALATATEQKETLTTAIGQMDALKLQVEAGWKAVSQESATRTGIAESIAGKQPVAGQATLLMAVKEIEGLNYALESDYGRAISAYEASAASASDASAAAQQAYKRAGELVTLYRGRPEEGIYKRVQTLLNTGGLRVNEVVAEYATGRTYADWSGLLKIRQDALTRLNEISQQVKLPVPQELMGSHAGVDKEMAAKASNALKKASADFEAIAGASVETKRTAGIGRIATQLALAEIADRNGDASGAQAYRQAAQTVAQDLTKEQPPEVKLPNILRQAAAGQ